MIEFNFVSRNHIARNQRSRVEAPKTIGYREAVRGRLTTGHYYAEGTLLLTALTTAATGCFLAAIAGKLPMPCLVREWVSRLDLRAQNSSLAAIYVGLAVGVFAGVGSGVQSVLQTGWSSDKKRIGNAKFLTCIVKFYLKDSDPHEEGQPL